jgi:CheY-like chemotaxis protein
MPAAETPAGRRVLVVDDDAVTRSSLVTLLEQWGHAARAAADGPSALREAKDFRPDAALVDVVMPWMDGYEVGRLLRRLPGVDGALLVSMTGYGDYQNFARSREAGFDHHLSKPLDLDRLRRLLGTGQPQDAS